MWCCACLRPMVGDGHKRRRHASNEQTSQACVVHRGYFGTDIANIETVGVQSIKGTKELMAIRSRKLSLLSTCMFLDGLRWLHRCFSRFGSSWCLRKAGKPCTSLTSRAGPTGAVRFLIGCLEAGVLRLYSLAAAWRANRVERLLLARFWHALSSAGTTFSPSFPRHPPACCYPVAAGAAPPSSFSSLSPAAHYPFISPSFSLSRPSPVHLCSCIFPYIHHRYQYHPLILQLQWPRACRL